MAQDDEMAGVDFDAAAAPAGELAPEREPEKIETVDDGAVSAGGAEPAAAPEPEKTEDPVTFDERQQAKLNELIYASGEARQKAEAERDEAARKLEAAQAQIPEEIEPAIPPLPDAYDDDYSAKMAERDAAITGAAEFRAKAGARAAQAEAQRVEGMRAQQEAFVKSVTDYRERSVKLGIDPGALQEAGQKIEAHGMDESVAAHILAMDQGPAVTMYLAANPVQLGALNRMSPMAAAVHIATQIAPAAIQAGKKTPPPEPPEHIEGGGARESDDMPGVKFY